MEERFFLKRVALHATRIAPGNVERATLVEPDLAHSRTAIRDGAIVAAGEATYFPVAELLVELTLSDILFENLTKRSHNHSIIKPHHSYLTSSRHLFGCRPKPAPLKTLEKPIEINL